MSTELAVLRSLSERLSESDRRSVVAGACAVIRAIVLPTVARHDPYNTTIIEQIEAWSHGDVDIQALSETHRRARNTRGAHEAVMVLDLATADPAGAAELVKALLKRFDSRLAYEALPSEKRDELQPRRPR